MNFLAMAANKLGNRLEEKFNNADSPFGRMAYRFGMGDRDVPTPRGLSNPDQLMRGLGQVAMQVPEANASATAEQERFATERGFKNYDQMMLWARQRQQPTGGTIQGASPTVAGEAGKIMDGQGAAMMHPRNMLDWVRNRIAGATGNR